MCAHQPMAGQFSVLNNNIAKVSNELNGLIDSDEEHHDEIHHGKKHVTSDLVLPSFTNEFINVRPKTCYRGNHALTAPPAQSMYYQGQHRFNLTQTQRFNFPVFGKEPHYAQPYRISKQICEAAQNSLIGASVAKMGSSYPFGVPATTSHSAITPGVGANLYSQSQPSCELFFLPSHSYESSLTNKQQKHFMPNASTYNYGARDNGTGAIRKSYNCNRYNSNNNYSSNRTTNSFDEHIDYDKVEVKMEELGFTEEIGERNPILRLIGMFRFLNYYLNDEFPFGPNPEKELLRPKSAVRNMSIQYHVVIAVKNCTIFICEKERILNANKLYDLEIYNECENSIHAVRKLCTQLNKFKFVKLEHKHMAFLSENWEEKAQQLESLLQQLCDQVRETNLFVHVFDWAMENRRQAEKEKSLNKCAETYVSYQNNGEDKDDDDQSHYSPSNKPRRAGMAPVIRYIG